MKNTTITEMLIAFALAVVSPVIANAGVWDDCLLWYNGGAVDKNGDGKFTDGEMVDVRHAGIADSPTHGGVLSSASTPYVNSVLIETNDVTFPLQNNRVLKCPVLNFTAPAETNGTKISVLGNVVKVPNVLPVDSTTYTALIRFRREKHHAWDSSYQNVMLIGRMYSDCRGISLALSNTAEDNKVYMGVDGSAYRDTKLALSGEKDEWHEVAVIANGTSASVGYVDTSAKTSAIIWKTIDGITEGALRPAEGGNLLIGGEGVGKPTDSSPGKTLFRGQVHMVSFWNRVLTTNEVMEAFSSAPSLFQVGLPNVDGANVFAGSAGGASISAQPEEWRKFPASLSHGDPVSISFTLDARQANLPQIVRLVPRTGASGCVSVSVNGVDCGTESVRGGAESCVYVPAECLSTVGENVCTITRTDAGAGMLGFNAVQMAGSWRIGYNDNFWNDTENVGNTSEDFYIEWSSCRWNWFRRTARSTHPLNVHLGDILGRWGNNRYIYTWKLKKGSDVGVSSMVVKLNGLVVDVKSNGSVVECPVQLNDANWHTYTLELDERNLLRGVDNVLRWDSKSSDTTYYLFDYHELTVRRPRKGFVITFR